MRLIEQGGASQLAKRKLETESYDLVGIFLTIDGELL